MKKQSKFNIPGGGWITIEQDGDKLITQAEGNAAGLLMVQIAKRGMTFNGAVSYCKMCLTPEKEILQEMIEQQLDFLFWCEVQVYTSGNNMDRRNEYEMLVSLTQYEIRLAERRLKRIK